MDLQAVITRLKEKVPDLSGRIYPTEDYVSLLRMTRTTSATGAAYVMPAGLRGGRADVATGVFRQEVSEVIAVVILVPAQNKGTGRVSTIDSLINDVLEGMAGWVPDEAIGPFQLVRGAMINLGNAVLAFQIDFSVPDQLRILT